MSDGTKEDDEIGLTGAESTFPNKESQRDENEGLRPIPSYSSAKNGRRIKQRHAECGEKAFFYCIMII